MKYIFALLFLLPVYSFMYGQTITGLVSFEDSSLPAGKVSVQAGGKEVFTDSLGNYSIQINPSIKRIRFDSGSMYYDPLEVDIKNDTTINATLKRSISVLEDLIVTAKVKSKRTPVYAAQQVKKSCRLFRRNQVTIFTDSNSRMELVSIEKQWPVIDYKPMSFWAKLIFENISYPAEMCENGVEGRVIAKFKIDVNGNLADLEIIRSPAPIFDNEVLRVLKLMPSWLGYKEECYDRSGGRSFNQLVSERGAVKYFDIFILPIIFKIEW